MDVELKAAPEHVRGISPLRMDEIALLRAFIHRHRNPFKKRCAIKSGNRLSYKRVDEVAYFFADGKMTYLVTQKESRKYHISQTLEELQAVLDPMNFFRISRKFIVNIDSINEVKGLISNRIEIRLNQTTEHELTVSRNRAQEFRRWLDQ